MKKKLALLLLSLGIVITGCAEEEPLVDIAPSQAPVSVEKPLAENLSKEVRLFGELRFGEVVTIFPEIQGADSVTEVLFEKGDFVKKGDVIARLDGKRVRESLDSARASYQTALKNFQSTAESLELAKDTYEKNKALYEAGALSKTQLENSALQASETKLSLARSQLEQARLQLENTEKLSDDLVIEAPIDGQILEIQLTSSSLATSQQLIQLASIDDLRVVVSATENLLPSLGVGDVAEVAFPALDLIVEARVDRIARVADGQSGLYPIDLKLENLPDDLKPGMKTRAKIFADGEAGALLVPVDALLSDDQGTFVFAVEDNRAVKKRVTTRSDNGEVAEVIAGLDAETLVIVRGQNFIEADEPVMIVGGRVE